MGGALENVGGAGEECLALREEVEQIKEKQEELIILMEGTMNMQKVALGMCQEKIFEELLQELEEQKIREALELVQRTHRLVKWEGVWARARMLQRLESSRAVGQWSGAHDNSSFGSCSFSWVLTDEVMSASSKMGQDAEEAMSESFWTAVAKEKERDWWSVEGSEELKGAENEKQGCKMEVDEATLQEARFKSEVQKEKRYV